VVIAAQGEISLQLTRGRLIAIMLGRLEMDVDECIIAYNKLIQDIFQDQLHRAPLSWSGRVQSQFDAAKLKAAVEEVVNKQGLLPTDPFNDGKPRGCKV
jgi:hypothetical protein